MITGILSQEGREEISQILENWHNTFSDSYTAKALSFVGDTAKGAIETGLGVAGNTLGLSQALNPNMPLIEKIPATVQAQSKLISKIPKIIGLCVDGALPWIPPVMLGFQVVGLTSSLAVLCAHQVERRKLQKKLISFEKVNQAIHNSHHYKVLNLEEKENLTVYAFYKKDLYLELYALRDQIIKAQFTEEAAFTLKRKEEAILLLNKKIECLSKNQLFDFDEADFDPLIVEKYAVMLRELSKRAKYYKEASEAIEAIKLKLESEVSRFLGLYKLPKKIENHRALIDEIYAQDLPCSIKEKIEKLLFKEDIEKEEVQLLCAQMGNYIISHSTLQQIKVKDNAYDKLLIKEKLSTKNKAMIQAYYQFPRNLYDALFEIRKCLREQSKWQAEQVLEKPLDDGIQELLNTLNFSEATFKDILEMKDLFPDLKVRVEAFFNLYKGFVENVQAYEDWSKQEDFNENLLALDKKIRAYRAESLQQYTCKDVEFAAPNIDFHPSEEGFLEQATQFIGQSSFIKKIEGKLKEVKQEVKVAHNTIIEGVFGEEGLERRTQNAALNAKTKQDKESILETAQPRLASPFELLNDKQRLTAREKTFKWELLTFGVKATLVSLSAADTISLMVAGAPLGQGSLAATITLAIVETGLSFTKVGLVAYTNHINEECKKIVKDPEEALQLAILPTLEETSHKHKHKHKHEHKHKRRKYKEEIPELNLPEKEKSVEKKERLPNPLLFDKTLEGQAESSQTVGGTFSFSTTNQPPIVLSFHQKQRENKSASFSEEILQKAEKDAEEGEAKGTLRSSYS